MGRKYFIMLAIHFNTNTCTFSILVEAIDYETRRIDSMRARTYFKIKKISIFY